MLLDDTDLRPIRETQSRNTPVVRTVIPLDRDRYCLRFTCLKAPREDHITRIDVLDRLLRSVRHGDQRSTLNTALIGHRTEAVLDIPVICRSVV